MSVMELGHVDVDPTSNSLQSPSVPRAETRRLSHDLQSLPFVIEQEACKSLAKFRFANTGRSEEKEGRDGS